MPHIFGRLDPATASLERMLRGLCLGHRSTALVSHVKRRFPSSNAYIVRSLRPSAGVLFMLAWMYLPVCGIGVALGDIIADHKLELFNSCHLQLALQLAMQGSVSVWALIFDCCLVHQRRAVIVHLNWVCIFLGFHSFGLSLARWPRRWSYLRFIWRSGYGLWRSTVLLPPTWSTDWINVCDVYSVGFVCG